MPARTKNSYTVPGGGTIVRGKSGAAKKFTGKGPPPAGTTKVAEPTIDTVPVVTVSPSGQTTTSNFPSEQAARRAKRAHRTARKRARRIVAQVERKAQKRSQVKQPVLAKYKADPSKAVISSVPNPQAKPPTFEGLKTAGTPTVKELKTAKKAGTLKVNAKGFATTPQVRTAAKKVKQAKRAVRKSGPSLAGLSPEERRAAKIDVGVGPKYGIPPSVLMAQQRQESGFNPAAVSSAGAQGISQFIPSTAESYGVQYGTGQPEVKSQIRGQAKLLHDSGFATDPKGAMSAYTGGYSDAEYNNPVLEGAADYKALDKPGNPRARRRLVAAKAKAAKLGLKAGQPKQAVGPAPKKVVSRYKAGRSAMEQLDRGNNAGKLPYVWGGHHGNSNSFDCSGAVSFALNKMKVLKGTLTSGEMGSVLKRGPGALTVFYNSEHTFIYDTVKGEYWGTSNSNVAGGPGYFPKSVGDAEVAEGNAAGAYNVGHVPGLGKKQAIQLGGSVPGVSGAQTFPGMTLSSSGATATIDPGAGATKGKPGFSKSPIRLTVQQKVARTNRKLKSLGVGVNTTATSKSSETGSVLSALERKYSVAG